jgi:hypothetical protein
MPAWKVGIMSALPADTHRFVLGLAVSAALACSAQASEPPPQQQTMHPGATAGSGGSGALLPVAGSATVGSAGTTAASLGGQPMTSTGGTTGTTTAGSGPVGSAGSAPTGTAGGGALAACPSPPAAGSMTDLLIDDLEDKDNGVAKLGGRSGYWYTYLDAFGSTITPKPDATGASPLLPGNTMCHGGMACVIISGTTAMQDEVAKKYPYAGVGFDFSNAKKPCTYNGSAYSGIKFWVRGDVAITIKLNTTKTSTADGGGTCIGDGCNGGYSPGGIDVPLTGSWQQLDLPFNMLVQPTWGQVATFDKASLLSLQVQVPPGQAFNIAIDDVTFY